MTKAELVEAIDNPFSPDHKTATAATSIVNTTMTATNGPGSDAVAPEISNSELPHIDRIRTDTAGAAGNYGVDATNGHVIVRNSQLYISGTEWSFYNSGGQPRLATSTVQGATAGMSSKCDLVVDANNNSYPCSEAPIGQSRIGPHRLRPLDGRMFVSQLQLQLSP